MSLIKWIDGVLNFFVRRLERYRRKLAVVRQNISYEKSRPDIFIVSYPKSGTTWMQMIVYQLTSHGDMGFRNIDDVAPFVERCLEKYEFGISRLASPGPFKTHLDYGRVPKGSGKYIYVVRDGRDVALSYFHHYRKYHNYSGSFEAFARRFVHGEVHYGSWFRHVRQWTANRRGLDVLVVRFEDLKEDLEREVRRIAAFCGLEVDSGAWERILERCSFRFMKAHEDKFELMLDPLSQPDPNVKFIREGLIGGGRTLFKGKTASAYVASGLRWLPEDLKYHYTSS